MGSVNECDRIERKRRLRIGLSRINTESIPSLFIHEKIHKKFFFEVYLRCLIMYLNNSLFFQFAPLREAPPNDYRQMAIVSIFFCPLVGSLALFMSYLVSNTGQECILLNWNKIF